MVKCRSKQSPNSITVFERKFFSIFNANALTEYSHSLEHTKSYTDCEGPTGCHLQIFAAMKLSQRKIMF